MSSSNTISNPFMILEHFQGTCLGDIYDDMPTQMKKSIVRSLVCLLKQLNEVTFDTIGTLISASPVGFGLWGTLLRLLTRPNMYPHLLQLTNAVFIATWKKAGHSSWQRSSAETQVTYLTCDSHRVSVLLWISCHSQTQIYLCVLCCII
jgi:hypothetical protein